MAASIRVRFLFVIGLIIVGLLVVPQFSISQASETTSLAPLVNRTNQTTLVQKAQQQGSLRVIVTLQVPYQAEKQLSPNAVAQQRAQIAAAGDRLLASLAGKAHEVTAKFEVFPFVALVGDAATLEAVFSSADVASVVESTLKRPSDLSSNLVIGSPTANTAGYTGAGYAVVVIDSGVQTNHPFLSGITVAEACFSRTVVANDGFTVCPNGQSTPISGAPAQTGAGSGVNCSITVSGCPHGTHVAGTAVGRNYAGGPGYNGVAPAASLIAIQVFTRFNSGCGSTPAPCIGAYDEDILGALQYVQTTLAPLHTIASINMSLGGSVNNTATCDTSPYFTAVGSLRSLNIATVIAAGNNGYTAGISAPACVSNAISVGATQDNDTIASFSNRASFMSLFAPGVSVDSSVPNSTYANYNGTSMAAPHVAGAWAAMRHRYPSETVTQILTRLQTSGQPITFGANTKSRIKLDSAASGGGSTATPITPTATGQPASCTLNEGFDNVAGLAGAGWSLQNLSTPIGPTGWSQGNSIMFPAFSGASNSYVRAKFNNVLGAGTISNWLLTPVLNLANGDTFSFWTRAATPGQTEYPDRLEVRLSTAGSSTNVGATNTSVGDFTTVLLTINPTLVTGVYPQVWTQFTATVAGLTTPTTGRVGFRYFVTNGGTGANSNYMATNISATTTAIVPTTTATNTATNTPTNTATATATNVSATTTAIVPTTTATIATMTAIVPTTTATIATTTVIVPTTTATVGTPSIYEAYIPLVIAAAPPPTATPTSLPTPTSMPVPPTGTWLELINYYRGLAGSSSVTDDTVLNNNCFEHARYMAENNDLTHNQTPGLPWASPAGQICAEKGNAWLGGAFEVPVWQPQSSIDSWLGSLGHRLWLLYPTTPTFGFGFYAASNNRAAAGLDVLSRANFAADTTYTHWPVRYPASNQTDIPATSYSISLNWAYFGASPTNVSTTLMTAGGANIAHTTTTALPAGHKGIGITPTSALPAQTTILVTVNGSYEGVPFTYSWQFTTR